MALIVNSLSSRLIQIFGNPSDNAVQKAQEISNAYHLYASTAQAGPLLPVFTGTESQKFLSKILPIFTNTHGNSSQFSNALAGAVEAFWLIPPVIFSGAGAGVVTSFTGKGLLISTLNSIFSSTYDKHEMVAVQIATAIDIATKTILVTYAPPPGSTANLV